MNMLPLFLKPSPDHIVIDPPLDLDSDFEEACRKEVQGLTRAPMQTPVERLKEATENILTVLRDRDTAHDDRISEYRVKLAAEEMAKEANLLEIAKTERALAELAYDPADDAKKSVVSARKSQTKKPPRCTVSPEVVQ